MVQWLRLHTPNAGDSGSISGWEIKIPHARIAHRQAGTEVLAGALQSICRLLFRPTGLVEQGRKLNSASPPCQSPSSGGGHVQPGPEDSSSSRLLRPSSGSGSCRNLASEAFRAQTSSPGSLPGLHTFPHPGVLAPLFVSPSPVSTPSAGGMRLRTLFEAQAGGVGKGVGLNVGWVSGLHLRSRLVLR